MVPPSRSTAAKCAITIGRHGERPEDNARYVIEPIDLPANRSNFFAPAGVLTHQMRWGPERATFRTFRGPRAGGRPTPDLGAHVHQRRARSGRRNHPLQPLRLPKQSDAHAEAGRSRRRRFTLSRNQASEELRVALVPASARGGRDGLDLDHRRLRPGCRARAVAVRP